MMKINRKKKTRKEKNKSKEDSEKNYEKIQLIRKKIEEN